MPPDVVPRRLDASSRPTTISRRSETAILAAIWHGYPSSAELPVRILLSDFRQMGCSKGLEHIAEGKFIGESF